MFGNAISDGGKRCRPLIFINTCNSGPTGVSLTLLGGWPSQFIQARAGAFIGTMWEIDDLLAVKFAKSFYTKLIRDKYNIAVAFRSARDDIREAMPHNSSWLAYVLYADPYAQMNY
jgi:CHAT domain-containing protein